MWDVAHFDTFDTNQPPQWHPPTSVSRQSGGQPVDAASSCGMPCEDVTGWCSTGPCSMIRTQTSENIRKIWMQLTTPVYMKLKYQVAELEDGKGHAVVWMCHLYNQFSNVPWPTPQTLPGSVRSQGESPVTRWIFTLKVLKFNKYWFNVSCSRRCSPFCDVPASMRRITETEHIYCSKDQQTTIKSIYFPLHCKV